MVRWWVLVHCAIFKQILMYLYFTRLPHPNTLSNVTHPGLVINQVQGGARKLYIVKWPCHHYLLHHVLPHGLWPYKERKQRKGILQLPIWR